MTARPWTSGELESIGASEELRISTVDAAGEWRRFVPIWVVRAEDEIYVRTWHRRDSGWFGRAVRTGRARIERCGDVLEVAVADVGTSEARTAVDAAYNAKYDRFGADSVAKMIDDDAAAATLRLNPV